MNDPRDAVRDLERMELHLRCLYAHDARGRILRSREPDGGPAARFHLGRTRLGNLWRFRADVPDEDVRSLARLAGREAPLAAPPGDREPAPPERLEPLRRVLARRGAVAFEWAGPAFSFPEDPDAVSALAHGVGADPSGRTRVVAVTGANAHVLERHFAEEIPQLAAREPCFAAVRDGSALSVCQAARPLRALDGSFEPCDAAEASVATIPDERGRGHAPRVVAAWAAAIAASGGRPLYSTSWGNRASRAVARKLALHCYGEDVHLT